MDRLTAPVNVNPSRILAVVIATPFYLVGAVLGLCYVLGVLVARGVAIGFADVRERVL